MCNMLKTLGSKKSRGVWLLNILVIACISLILNVQKTSIIDVNEINFPQNIGSNKNDMLQLFNNMYDDFEQKIVSIVNNSTDQSETELVYSLNRSKYNNIFILYSLIKNKKYLIYAVHDPFGTGNFLLHYYYYRSIAYYFNMEFVWLKYDKRNQYDPQLLDTINLSKYFKHIIANYTNEYKKASKNSVILSSNNNPQSILYHLKRYSSNTFENDIQQLCSTNANCDILRSKFHKMRTYIINKVFLKYYNESDILQMLFNDFENIEPTTMFKFHRDMFWWPWQGDMSHILYGNDLFPKHILQTEMNEIFEKTISSIKRTKIQSEINQFDIAAHFRCGDVINVKANFNGFFKLDYYENVLKYITKKYKNNDVFRHAYIVMNILDDKQSFQTKSSYFRNKKRDHVKCRKLWNFIKYDMNELFLKYNYTMILIDHGSINEDIYRLANAPFLICFRSTFCEISAYANSKLINVWYQKNHPEFIMKEFLNINPAWKTTQEINGNWWNVYQLSQYILSNYSHQNIYNNIDICQQINYRKYFEKIIKQIKDSNYKRKTSVDIDDYNIDTVVPKRNKHAYVRIKWYNSSLYYSREYSNSTCSQCSHTLYFKKLVMYMSDLFTTYGQYIPDFDALMYTFDGRQISSNPKSLTYDFITDSVPIISLDADWSLNKYVLQMIPRAHILRMESVNRQLSLKSFDIYHSKWENKKNVAIFRGGHLGCEIDYVSQRQITMKYILDYISNNNDKLNEFIDFKFVNLGKYHKGCCRGSNEYCKDILKWSGGKFKMDHIEESMFKYIIVIDGWTVRDALHEQFCYNSIILKQKSSFKEVWYDYTLKNWHNYIEWETGKDLIEILLNITEIVYNYENRIGNYNNLKYKYEYLKSISINGYNEICNTVFTPEYMQCFMVDFFNIYNKFFYDSSSLYLSQNDYLINNNSYFDIYEPNKCNFIVAKGPDKWAGFATAMYIYPISFLQFAERNNVKLWIDYKNEYNNIWYDNTKSNNKSNKENTFEYYFEGINPTTYNCIHNYKITKVLTMNTIDKIHGNPKFVMALHYGNDYGENKNIYNERWYYKHRLNGNKFLTKYLKLHKNILSEFDTVYNELLPEDTENIMILGIHMRGSDKTAPNGMTRRDVRPNEYYSYIKRFIGYYKDAARIIFATDDNNYFMKLKNDWNILISNEVNEYEYSNFSFDKIVKYQNNIIRSNTIENVFSFNNISKYELGKQILFDILLLSKSDWLIYSASAVAESVIYNNIQLHFNSVNLEYTQNRNIPIWFRNITVYS